MEYADCHIPFSDMYDIECSCSMRLLYLLCGVALAVPHMRTIYMHNRFGLCC